MRHNQTSWGSVADWYDDYLAADDTYQAKVIWPNLKRILLQGQKKSERLLDMACGQGYFSFLANNEGFFVTGVDISPELVAHAKARHITGQRKRPEFFVAPSHNMSMIPSGSFDTIVCVLALQNIKELDATFAECKRILTPKGRLIFVLNHPSFRIPQYSDWSYNEKTKMQSRIVSKYMQETTIKIDMHPGSHTNHKKFTISFHRPLQLFVKLLAKNNFIISRLEEWVSHKKTEAGPRKSAEDEARKEIPMFMCIEAEAK